MREGTASKLSLDMTNLCTIHRFDNWIMGNPVNIDMTISTGNIPMKGMVVQLRVYVVVPQGPILLVSSDSSIFVAQETIFGV